MARSSGYSKGLVAPVHTVNNIKQSTELVDKNLNDSHENTSYLTVEDIEIATRRIKYVFSELINNLDVKIIQWFFYKFPSRPGSLSMLGSCHGDAFLSVRRGNFKVLKEHSCNGVITVEIVNSPGIQEDCLNRFILPSTYVVQDEELFTSKIKDIVSDMIFEYMSEEDNNEAGNN